MDYRLQILLGRITRIHGNEGSASVKLEKDFIDNIPDMESVFLEIEGKPVPFFISGYDYTGGITLRLKFLGYETYEKLTELNGCSVFLSYVPENFSRSDRNFDLTGYRILTPQNVILGSVTQLIENPGQLLLSVKTEEGRVILVPFHEDLIVKYDRKKKLIIMDLPEGLQEINR